MNLPPFAHIFVTDILPFALSYFCAYLSIHMEGKVGILDTNDIFGQYIGKRGDTKVRHLDDEETYQLNQLDPDRKFYDMDADNEVIDEQIDFRKVTKSKDGRIKDKMKGVVI